MTQTQKKLAIIAIVIVIALLLLLSGKKSAANVTTENIPSINVDIPGFSLPDRVPITIPGLPSGSTYEFQAISPCMCNGQSLASSSGSGLQFVINQGGSGPTVYNYTTMQPTQPNYSCPVGTTWTGQCCYSRYYGRCVSS